MSVKPCAAPEGSVTPAAFTQAGEEQRHLPTGHDIVRENVVALVPCVMSSCASWLIASLRLSVEACDVGEALMRTAGQRRVRAPQPDG
jgi:hypothetical protein